MSARTYTVHVRAGRSPVLVAEGFCWAALVLPLPWLLLHRLWLVSALWTAVAVAAIVVAGLHPAAGIAASVALSLGTGIFARDLQRFTLGLRGWREQGVVLGADADDALARLLTREPGIAVQTLGARP